MSGLAKNKFLSMLACITSVFSQQNIHANQASQTTSTVMMVPPDGFKHNEQTAASNVFQSNVAHADTTQQAMQEFNNMVNKLRSNDVDVLVLQQDRSLPDAVFPNNWFSTHIDADGKTIVYIYPMLTPNRQAEVNIENLSTLLNKNSIKISNIIDIRKGTDKILEGTGSLIFDRTNKIIYAALSERTNKELVDKIAADLHYRAVIFHAVDANNKPIYHTNVLMGLADDYAVICLSCIADENERKQVIDSLEKSGKIIVDISQDQLREMCGNVLAVHNKKGDKLLVMSERAQKHFTAQQLATISKYSKIIPVDISIIEEIGGGSARCMLAEIYHS